MFKHDASHESKAPPAAAAPAPPVWAPVRVLFVCDSVTSTKDGDAVSFTAPKGADNANYGTAGFSLHVTGDRARGQFKPGESYFVDVTPAKA